MPRTDTVRCLLLADSSIHSNNLENDSWIQLLGPPMFEVHLSPSCAPRDPGV